MPTDGHPPQPPARPGPPAAEAAAPLIAFIVGMSRSGTTWLGRCLGEHPDVAVIGETKFWGRLYRQPDQRGRYSPDAVREIVDRLTGEGFCSDLDGMHTLRGLADRNLTRRVLQEATGDLIDPTPAVTFREICRAVADGEGAQVVLEKTPHHVNWTDRIISALPDSRFVILYRDPYDFMLSYKHQGDRKSPDRQRFYERLYHPLGCALVWRGYARAVGAASRRLPERALVLSAEDIGARPAETLAEVQRLLGLRVVDLTTPPTNTSFPDGTRPELGADDVFWMNLIARRELRERGIAARPALPRSNRQLPSGLGRIAWSAIRMPWWSMQTLKLMRREHVDDGVARYLWRWLRPPG